MATDSEFDLESLVHLEQTFYDSGYKDGFAHGRIHGLIEGRALGREKGFEMWEELGFYEGFARLWEAVCLSRRKTDDRALHHIKHLQDLVAQFPRSNPSSASNDSAGPAGEEIDIQKLFRQIRSRYKALCSTLGVRPSLRASSDEQTSADALQEDDTSYATMNGVDGGQKLKKSVWKLENSSPMESQGMDY